MDYKDHPNGAREQGVPEGGLPWEVQCALDLEEDSPQITEDQLYIAQCLGSLPAAKYSDGSHYVTGKRNMLNKSVYFHELLMKKGKRK